MPWNLSVDPNAPYKAQIVFPTEKFTAHTLRVRIDVDPMLRETLLVCTAWLNNILKEAAMPAPVSREVKERLDWWKERARIAGEKALQEQRREQSNLKLVPIREGE